MGLYLSYGSTYSGASGNYYIFASIKRSSYRGSNLTYKNEKMHTYATFAGWTGSSIIINTTILFTHWGRALYNIES